MEPEMKKRLAVFRYGVIADFVDGRHLSSGETEQLFKEKCAKKWDIPGSTRTSIGKSTLKEWVVKYKRSGNRLESLYPRDRCDRGSSRVLDGDVTSGIIALRKELPEVSLPVLLKEARVRKIILPGMKISYSTLYRFLKSENLLDKPASVSDRRRFEAESPNDLWQSDVMHGPFVDVNGKKRKTYLIAFLDDMSRMALYGEFYLQERLDSFLEALKKAFLMRGIPRKLYVDNGPAFRSHHLEHICASLGIALRHSRPYQPEGRGKIERWFRTVRGSFLSTHKATTLEDLNEKFSGFLTHYNETRHSSTSESPFKRFAKGIECLRVAPNDLEDHFRKSVRRRVSRDRTIALNNRIYEAPVELIGKQVTLLYHEDDPARVEILFGGNTYGFIVLVDVNVNSRIKRGGVTEMQNNPDRYRPGLLFKLGGDQ